MAETSDLSCPLARAGAPDATAQSSACWGGKCAWWDTISRKCVVPEFVMGLAGLHNELEGIGSVLGAVLKERPGTG